MEFTAEQIAAFLGGEVEGEKLAKVSNFAKIEEAQQGDLTFLYNPKYYDFIYSTKASIVLVNNDISLTAPITSTLVKVENAYQSLAKLLQLYAEAKPKKTGVESLAFVSEDAAVGEDCYIANFAYISPNATLGNNVKVYPNSFIGEGVKIGDNTHIYSGVHIYEGCKIGKDCTLHSGAVIGADGFGFAQQQNNEYNKIPQIGIVVLGDNVEIGANTCVDRSTMGTTIVGDGSKFDNLVQIGHNVEVGNNTIMCAQSGIAGSTKLEDNNIVGGQAGINGHIKIGSNNKIAGQTGVAANLQDDALLMGTPGFNLRDFQRSSILFKKLPDLYSRISKLEKELSRLEKKANNA